MTSNIYKDALIANNNTNNNSNINTNKTDKLKSKRFVYRDSCVYRTCVRA
jgi:hypothetical protein